MISITKTQFVKSAAKPSDFPKDMKKHIVFAGRSNVGKSSTINSLVCRKNFARVSAKPGKTVFVNLFDTDGAFWLVDLPGYGYAQTSAAEKKRFSALIDEYFSSQSSKIARLYLIVDIRHKPTKDDVVMINFARQMGIKTTIVANKLDKLKKSEIDPCIDLVAKTLDLSSDELLIPFSAEKSTNRDLVVSDIICAVGE